MELNVEPLGAVSGSRRHVGNVLHSHEHAAARVCSDKAIVIDCLLIEKRWNDKNRKEQVGVTSCRSSDRALVVTFE